jgi:heterotetrameric sarcosine oxidase gamma subunit
VVDLSEDVTIEEPSGIAMVSLAARLGGASALSDAVREAWGVALPMTPRRVEAGDLAFIWAGAERWLVTFPRDTDLAGALRTHLGAFAAMTDQGAGRAMFRVSGAGARGMLARLIQIDLHPTVFAPGDTALTIAAHINVQIWQIDDLPTYDITVFRSLAESFRRALGEPSLSSRLMPGHPAGA